MSGESSKSSSSSRSSSSTPTRSPSHSSFSNMRAQQRRMQEQMDHLAAQMTQNYYGPPHYPYYPEEVQGSYSTRFPQPSFSNQSPSPSKGRNYAPSSGSSQSTPRGREDSSSGSQRSSHSRPSPRKGPYERRNTRERSPTTSCRRRFRSPESRIPIIIQQNTQAEQPRGQEGMWARLARLEELASGTPLDAPGWTSPFTE